LSDIDKDEYSHITQISRRRISKMPVLVPYLIGVVTAPLAAKVVKPMLRGIVKTTAGVTLEAKRVAAEASEEAKDRHIAGRGERRKAAKASVARDRRAHDETVHEVNADLAEADRADHPRHVGPGPGRPVQVEVERPAKTQRPCY
jgi:Protein of unknown function (DUF5132)